MRLQPVPQAKFVTVSTFLNERFLEYCLQSAEVSGSSVFRCCVSGNALLTAAGMLSVTTIAVLDEKSSAQAMVIGGVCVLALMLGYDSSRPRIAFLSGAFLAQIFYVAINFLRQDVYNLNEWLVELITIGAESFLFVLIMLALLSALLPLQNCLPRLGMAVQNYRSSR